MTELLAERYTFAMLCWIRLGNKIMMILKVMREAEILII